jgi:methyltransferase
MNLWPSIIIGLVVVERAVELLYSRRNSQALTRRGAVEVGKRRFLVIVGLHAAWLAAVVIALPAHAGVAWFWVGVLALLQPIRLWVMASLGPYWTTRILILPGAPLVRTGPYRFLRHPAYLTAGVEIAVLPLAFGEVRVAAAFFVLNAVVMTLRARQEDAALAAVVSFVDGAEPSGGLNPASLRP